MPEAVLEEIKSQATETHTKLMTVFTEMKAHGTRMEAIEEAAGHVPADLKETLAQIDTAIEGFDTKHSDLISQYDAVEEKLNALEEMGGEGVASKEEKLHADHMAEFKEFIRYGEQKREGGVGANGTTLADMQQKTMYAGSDPDGGFVIPRPMSGMIQTAKRDATPFRQEAASTTISGDMFKYLIDIGEADKGWVTERALRGKTGTPTLQEASITVNEMYAGPALTQTILDDAAFPIESWLSGKVAEAFGDLEANAFLLGNGVGKPRGVLTYDAGNSWGEIAQVMSGGATAITADQLMEQQDALKETYAGNAKWYMNRRTVTPIRQLKTTDDQYIWQPGIQAGAPTTLLGDPIVRMNYMPTVAADSLSVMFGDLKKAYLIVDRYATRVLRDPYTQTPYVIFKTNARVGGDVVNFEAVNIMKTGAVA